MNIAVRYYSRSGNTKKLAEAAAKAAGVDAQDVSAPLSEKADILLLGCSYYAFDVDEAVKRFIADNKENIGKIVCLRISNECRVDLFLNLQKDSQGEKSGVIGILC